MKLAGAVVLLTACWAHDPGLQRRVDDLSAQLAQTQHELERIRHMVEAMQKPAREGAAAPAPTANLDRKIDELDKKLDAMLNTGAKPSYRPPARPEPDRSKTYAIQVDGHPSEG